MDVFERLKRFKEAKHRFLDLPDQKRAQLIHRWTGLLESEAIALTKREQAKLMFMRFYDRDGEALVDSLLGKDKP